MAVVIVIGLFALVTACSVWGGIKAERNRCNDPHWRGGCTLPKGHDGRFHFGPWRVHGLGTPSEERVRHYWPVKTENTEAAA